MPTMDIAARLIAADSRWDTVRGTFRAWRNGALTTQAFLEWNDIDMTTEGRHDGSSRVVVTAAVHQDAEGANDSYVEHVLSVCAAEQGRRRRAEAISRSAEQWMADLVVVDGPWFWARTGGDLKTNDGDPGCTHGGADFVLLLAPKAVPEGFDLTPTGLTETVAGRSCDLVIATPRARAPYGEHPHPGAEVFGMISGGREFRLHVDERTSTIMRVTKVIGGKPAEIVEFMDIVFDEPLDQRLFLPPQ